MAKEEWPTPVQRHLFPFGLGSGSVKFAQPLCRAKYPGAGPSCLEVWMGGLHLELSLSFVEGKCDSTPEHLQTPGLQTTNQREAHVLC